MPDFVKLLGCYHKLQLRCFSFSDDQKQTRHRQQQRHFAQTVAEMLIDDEFRFVGEEIGHDQESIVELVAQAFLVSFDKIDMPMALRIKSQCGPLCSNPVSIPDFPSKSVWQANKYRCHALREEYMFRRSMEFIQNSDPSSFAGRSTLIRWLSYSARHRSASSRQA